MNKKILMVTAEYYPDITEKLELKTLEYIKKKNFDILISKIRVPGVFEIPVIISKYISNFDGVIALGCVIKGETPHFDLISRSVTNGIMNLSIDNKKPIGNGILSCLDKNQALKRTDKGIEAANAVLSILSIKNDFKN